MKKTKNYLILMSIFLTAGILFAEDEQNDANWAKTKSYIKPINSPDPIKTITTTSFLDGLGREIQTQAELNSHPKNALISGAYTDVMGRDSVSIKPYVAQTEGLFVSPKNHALIHRANSYYNGSSSYRPDAGGVAYSETGYWPDGSVKEIGSPGIDFSLEVTGHHVKKWHFFVNPGVTHPLLNLDSDGFVVYNDLTEQNLDDLKKGWETVIDFRNNLQITPNELSPGDKYILESDYHIYQYNSDKSWTEITPNDGDIVYVIEKNGVYTYNGTNDTWIRLIYEFTYLLKIAKDQNNRYSQSLTDKFGRVVKKCSDLENSERIVTTIKYDILGNILEEIPPDPDNPGITSDDHKSEAVYNTLGQIIKKRTPDYGTKEYRYDNRGNIKYMKDSLHLFKEEESENPPNPDPKEFFIMNKYDELNRLVSTMDLVLKDDGVGKTWFDQPDAEIYKEDVIIAKRLIDNIYDTITKSELESYAPDKDPEVCEVIVGELSNLKRRLVASIKYNIDNKKVVDLFSYDEKGVANKTYKIIPAFLPVQKDSFAYDFSGDITEDFHYNGCVVNQGIATWIQTKNQNNNFDTDKRLKSVSINGEKAVEYFYSENGIRYKKSFFERTNGSPIEDISYEYNISGWLEKLKTEQNTDLFNQSLYYNNTPASGFSSQFTPLYNGNISGIHLDGKKDDVNDYSYKLSYLYDRLNRLENVIQDNSSDGEDYDEILGYDYMGRIKSKQEGSTLLDDYNYKPKSSQLEYILGSVNKKPTTGGQPNYLYDPNGNMVLDRSKNMVIVYDSNNMPVLFKFYDDIPDIAFAWNTLTQLDTRTDVIKLAEVEMLYDASGSRVKKLTYSY